MNKMLTKLCIEIDRLCERYVDNPIAVEALEQVKWWAMEESVPPVEE